MPDIGKSKPTTRLVPSLYEMDAPDAIGCVQFTVDATSAEFSAAAILPRHFSATANGEALFPAYFDLAILPGHFHVSRHLLVALVVACPPRPRT